MTIPDSSVQINTPEQHMNNSDIRRPTTTANIPTIETAAPLASVCSPTNQDTHESVSTSTLASRNSLVDHKRRSSWNHNQHAEKEKALVDDLHRTSTSNSSTSTVGQNDLEDPVSRVSTDARGNIYPERGTQAYLVVLGSFCGCMLSLGLMNTISTYQAYLTTHQLSHLTTSTVGWIFGIYAFLSFFLGVQIGPLFDAFGPRYLVAAGSICILLTYILLAQCTTFWHFLVVFGILGGTGTSLVFTPSVAAVGHWFYARRGTFTGLACVGGSMGGIVFSLTLQALFNKQNIGWAWSQRILALINLPLAICANLFVRSRLPPTRPVRKEAIFPDPRIFRNKTFALVTLAVFFVEWGLFVPIGYLTNFALSIGIDEQFSYQLIAIFNAGSCLGRWLPGLLADRIGRFNAMTLTTLICWIGLFAFWIPSELLSSSVQSTRVALLICFSVVFGFGSGAGISLVPVCVGQLCKTEEYGRYYATCYTVVSFATLTGIPLAGSLVGITGTERQYWALIVFTGLSYMVSTLVFVVAKGTKVGFGRELWMKRF